MSTSFLFRCRHGSRIGLAATALALAAWAAPAQASKVFLIEHGLQASTRASTPVRVSGQPTDDTLFDRSIETVGLGPQGAITRADASQAVFFDVQHGARGQGAASVALGEGVEGLAVSRLTAVFDIAERSTFSADGLLETSGSGVLLGKFELLKLNADDTQDLIFSLSEGAPGLDLDGFLDAGRYLLSVISLAQGPDGGVSGSSRFDFDFRFDALEAANHVPEPSSVALVLGALLAGRAVRRRGAP